MELLELLRNAGATVSAYDPMASAEEYQETTTKPLAKDPYDMATGCHGVLVVTAWPEFANLDWQKLQSVMAAPYIFYDTRNFLLKQEADIRAAGFTYTGVGR